jgi:PAS domain S-box-containing protein
MNTRASKDSEPAQPANLRRKAEERLRATEGNHGPPRAEVDARALVHELQVHQIELEMQKEELQRARVPAEEASEKYGDLFDFAPVGYFLWGHDTRILEVNLAGATLLGLDRNAVIHKRFGQFVALENRPAFADFCERVLTTDTKQTCEIKLLKDGQGVAVLVEGIAAQDRQEQGKLCRAVVIDITQQKRTDELTATNEALRAEIAARQRADVALRSAAQFPDENPCPVVRIDRAGTVLYVNRSSIALCGEWRCEIGQPAPESFARLARETLDSGQARQVDVETGGLVFSFLLAPIAESGYVNLYGRDITDRKQTQEVLKQSEERYRSLFNTLIEGFCIIEVVFDAHGRPIDYRFLDVNPAFEKQTGLHDARGKLMRDLAPEHEAHWFDIYGKIALTGEPARFVNEAKALDRWFDVSAFRFGGTESRKVAILFNDITESKRAEAALRESEALLKAVTESTEDAIYAKDCDGRLLLVNPATLRSVGKPANQIVGHTDAEFYDDPAISAAIRENDLRLMAGGVPQVFEETVDTPDGRRIMWSSKVPWRDAQGRIIGIIGVSRDITDRKRAEEETRRLHDVVAEERDRLSALVNSITDEIWFADTEGRFTLTNPSASREFSLGMADATNARQLAESLEVLSPDGSPRPIEETPPLRALRGEVVRNLEEIVRTPATGELRHRQVNSSPVRDAKGNIIGSVSVVHDITERRQVEDALRKSEQEFRALAEAVPQIVWATRPDGWNIYFNQQWMDYTGLTLDESYGHGWNTPFHPEDKQRAWDAWQRATQHNETYLLECRLRRADGVYRWWLIHGAPLRDANGEIQKWFGTCTDIEALKQAEEALRDREQQFRTLADSIPNLAWWANGDGYLTWYNRQWYEYTGTTPEQMEGWGWQSVHDPDELPRVMERWKASLATGEPFTMEFPLRGRDGQFRWFLTRVLPLKDADGRVVRWFGTNTDVTEVRQARQAAEAANVSKSQFLASMSHELRTPMNAILGMTDLALAEQLPSAVRDYLQTSKESADLLLELLNEILDFSRIEAGRFELESTPFRLRKTVAQAVKTLALRAYEKGLELVFQVADELPDTVVGDSLRLRQVLMNLVSNAIKFTPNGEVVVRVGASDLGLGSSALGLSSQNRNPKTQNPRPKSQDLTSNTPYALCALQFSVFDTGIGIAPEKLEEIFAPFTQADSSTTRRFGGTGLGLAISQRLVNLMGGHIRVESQPGRGSTFHFTLMLPIAEQADDEGEVTAGDQDLFRGLPALVIAASATSRKIFQQTLASWLMQVDEAPDVPSGLAKIHEAAAAGQAYRVVLADAVMPGIDGFTLVDWLQQDPRLAGSVILVLSATDRHNYPDQCRNLTTPCLEKPVSPSVLFNAIAKAVGADGLACMLDSSKTAAVLPVPRQILRVLVAEDTPANRKLVLHVLGNRGHNVTIAENGRQALELLQEQDFDVVLMDVQMPEMDGFQATEAIRKLEDPKKARLPVIAMTAHALRGDQERCLAAGMDGYLSKPIKSPELVGLVERLAQKGLGGGDGGLEKSEQPTTPDSESLIPHLQSLIPVFNLDEAVSKCCGKYELFQEVASCLFCEADSLLEQMRAAFSAGAATEFADAAHRLKGTVAYLGAAPALAATRCAEDIGRSGDLSTAPAALETLAMELGLLKDAIDGHRPPTQ